MCSLVEFSKCLIGDNVIEIRNEVKVGMTKGKSASYNKFGCLTLIGMAY